MKRRQFLQTLTTATAGSMLPFGACNQMYITQKPNIIFIMADDLGYGDLGCYGQEKIKTPHLDQMAEKGVRFTDCYAGATICAPSRSVLMTGQHTGHTRIRGNTCQFGGTIGYKGATKIRRMNLTKDDITMPQILQQAGYRTCLAGKWHIGGFNPDGGPLNRGFDEFYGPLTRSGKEIVSTYWPVKDYHNHELVDVIENKNGKQGKHGTILKTDHAIEFIHRNQHQPFFLYMAYSNPHSPYTAPGPGPYENENWPIEEKTYATMIHYLDLSVGRVLETLKNLKLEQNTIVFFCSDNGPRSENKDMQTRVIDFFNSNGPLKGYKRDLYDGGIRIPMIVQWLGHIPSGKTSRIPWYFADLLPTAASVAKTESPEHIDGINMLPYLTNPDKKPDERYLYWEFFGNDFRQAVRWNNWKAIRMQPGLPLLLFDLDNDIGEEKNVAAGHPDIIRTIEKYLETARTESPYWPVKDNSKK